MILSLNLPDDVVAFIDQQATLKKMSRSAFIAALLRNIQLVESPAGRRELARTTAALMAEGALRSGQSIDQVRKAFPQFEQYLADEQSPDAPQLPAAHHATPPTPSNAISVAVTRRRPYQRAASRLPRHKQP